MINGTDSAKITSGLEKAIAFRWIEVVRWVEVMTIVQKPVGTRDLHGITDRGNGGITAVMGTGSHF